MLFELGRKKQATDNMIQELKELVKKYSDATFDYVDGFGQKLLPEFHSHELGGETQVIFDE